MGGSYYDDNIYTLQLNDPNAKWINTSLKLDNEQMYGGYISTQINNTIYFIGWFFGNYSYSMNSYNLETNEIKYNFIPGIKDFPGYLTSDGISLLFNFDTAHNIFYYYDLNDANQREFKIGASWKYNHILGVGVYLKPSNTILIYGGPNTTIIEYISVENAIKHVSEWKIATAKAPYPVIQLTPFAVDNGAYFIGGEGFLNATQNIYFDNVYYYDFDKDTITDKNPSIPFAEDRMGSISINGTMYLFGGNNGSYDSNQWFYSNHSM